jgi:hypothetical protein
MSWKISFALVLALITGCSTTPVVTEYVTIYKVSPIICNVPEPVSQNMLPIKLDKVFSSTGEWWITADDANYKKLAVNNGKILKYLEDEKGVNKELRKCIKDNNDKAKKES